MRLLLIFIYLFVHSFVARSFVNGLPISFAGRCNSMESSLNFSSSVGNHGGTFYACVGLIHYVVRATSILYSTVSFWS